MYGNRIKTLRETRGFTQEDLAEMLGVGVNQIYRWENDRTDPRSDMIVALADALMVSADFLLGRTDDTSIQLSNKDLSAQEREIISSMRRGDTIGAIKAIIKNE